MATRPVKRVPLRIWEVAHPQHAVRRLVPTSWDRDDPRKADGDSASAVVGAPLGASPATTLRFVIETACAMVATLVMALANVVSGHAVCLKLTTLKRFPL